MRKWLVIGVLVISLVASWAPNGAAVTWIFYQGVWIKVGTLEVTSNWFAKVPLETRPATWAVAVTPLEAKVSFANPGGNLGGTASVNFLGNQVGTTLESAFYPELLGKKNISDTIIFGDCGDCSSANLPQDGALWLMFLSQTTCAEPQLDNVTQIQTAIQCVKDWLVSRYEPNTQWVANSVLLTKFNLVLRGWEDYDKDCLMEEVVYARYTNFTLGTDGVTYSTSDEPSIWQYSYPKSVNGDCSVINPTCVNPATEICDCEPQWGTYGTVDPGTCQ